MAVMWCWGPVAARPEVEASVARSEGWQGTPPAPHCPYRMKGVVSAAELLSPEQGTFLPSFFTNVR